MGAVDIARESVECFSAGDFDRFRSLLADDSVEHEYARGRDLQGADAQVEAAQGWREAFPDAHGTIEATYADGDTAVLQITWSGTQAGPLRTPDGQELPPSNRRAEVKAVQVIRTDGDRIKEVHHYFDLMTLLQQIGALEQAPA